ncbi:Polyadenylate-binding protein 4 [Trifolium repens]|nr:Polyadenylate-binding protein 4 [Trifolium repens]
MSRHHTLIDNKALHDTFFAFCTVLSCKVVVNSNGQSTGYGLVRLDNDESAKYAIEQLDGMLISDKKVYVTHFIRRQERSGNGSPKFTNVYFKNLSETYINEDLKQLFNIYGVITSVVVMKYENGNSNCFGFVNFQSPDPVVVAVERLNGTATNDGKVLFVGRAQRKFEREAELKAKFAQAKIKRYEKLKVCKNLAFNSASLSHFL